MTDPANDALEVHDLVADINILQEETGSETTIATPQPTDD